MVYLVLMEVAGHILPTPGKAHAVEKIGDVYVAGRNFIGYYEENLKGNSVFTPF
jgi:hypothetical protein